MAERKIRAVLKKPASPKPMTVKSRAKATMPAIPGLPTFKRPVLTITLSQTGMGSLDRAVETFQRMAARLPLLDIPTTKAAVAGWVVNRFTSRAEGIMKALLWESERKDTVDAGSSVLPGSGPAGSEDVATPEMVAAYSSFLEQAQYDPFFIAMRHLLKLPQE